jgi:hypothetical protein
VDPSDTRERCLSRRGFFSHRQCELPKGHPGPLHFNSGGGTASASAWSVSEVDCECGLEKGHIGLCPPRHVAGSSVSTGS